MSDGLKFVFQLLAALFILAVVMKMALFLITVGKFILGSLIVVVMLMVIFWLGDVMRERVSSCG